MTTTPTSGAAALPEALIHAGMQALLQCSASDLENLSITLFEIYSTDVQRVFAAMIAKAISAEPYGEDSIQSFDNILAFAQTIDSQACKTLCKENEALQLDITLLRKQLWACQQINLAQTSLLAAYIPGSAVGDKL